MHGLNGLRALRKRFQSPSNRVIPSYALLLALTSSTFESLVASTPSYPQPKVGRRWPKNMQRLEKYDASASYPTRHMYLIDNTSSFVIFPAPSLSIHTDARRPKLPTSIVSLQCTAASPCLLVPCGFCASFLLYHRRHPPIAHSLTACVRATPARAGQCFLPFMEARALPPRAPLQTSVTASSPTRTRYSSRHGGIPPMRDTAKTLLTHPHT
jgi:hypothetical protein